jgi:hypothetical protein
VVGETRGTEVKLSEDEYILIPVGRKKLYVTNVANRLWIDVIALPLSAMEKGIIIATNESMITFIDGKAKYHIAPAKDVCAVFTELTESLQELAAPYELEF